MADTVAPEFTRFVAAQLAERPATGRPPRDSGDVGDSPHRSPEVWAATPPAPIWAAPQTHPHE